MSRILDRLDGLDGVENSQGLESWTAWRDQVSWMGEIARVTNVYGILANLINVILWSRSHLPGINYWKRIRKALVHLRIVQLSILWEMNQDMVLIFFNNDSNRFTCA